MERILIPSIIKLGGKSKDQLDPRLKDVIQRWRGGKIDAGIIGIPFDYGVKLSNGRTGAAEAPDAIRKEIKRYGTAYNVEKEADIATLCLADFGNIAVFARDSLKTHNSVTAAVRYSLQYAKTVIILGGGNDLSYATVKAFTQASGGKSGGMNVDAHFDVRPVRNGKITSGTPYRRLLEEKIIAGNGFWEVASQGQVNAIGHKFWLENRQAKIVFLSEIRQKGVKTIFERFAKSCRDCKQLFVSIDIDSVAQAFAPGSSAPSPDGLTPNEILELSYWAGLEPRVKLFEIMEVNPKYDIDGRTLRLSVNIILNFLAGLAKR